MLGHLSIGVRDLERARPFYDAVMATIGWEQKWPGDPEALGYGPPGGKDKLAVFRGADAHPPGPGFHLCFNAPTDAAVDAFHAAALANGGRRRRPARSSSAFRPRLLRRLRLRPGGLELSRRSDAGKISTPDPVRRGMSRAARVANDDKLGSTSAAGSSSAVSSRR